MGRVIEEEDKEVGVVDRPSLATTVSHKPAEGNSRLLCSASWLGLGGEQVVRGTEGFNALLSRGAVAEARASADYYTVTGLVLYLG